MLACDRKHFGKHYDVCGPRGWSARSLADLYATRLLCETRGAVRTILLTAEAFHDSLLAIGYPEHLASSLSRTHVDHWAEGHLDYASSPEILELHPSFRPMHTWVDDIHAALLMEFPDQCRDRRSQARRQSFRPPSTPLKPRGDDDDDYATAPESDDEPTTSPARRASRGDRLSLDDDARSGIPSRTPSPSGTPQAQTAPRRASRCDLEADALSGIPSRTPSPI